MSVNNAIKILTYIYPITKQPISYLGNIWNPVSSICLRETLFCKDECLVCGRCCIPENNVFLPFEVDNMREIIKNKSIDTTFHKLNGKGYENIEQLLNSLQPSSLVINEKPFSVFVSSLPCTTYTINDRGLLKRCHWLLPTEDNRLGCGIHPVSSITCRMPHIRFFYNRDRLSTTIGHSQYGRNWALKCPAQVSKTEFSFDALNTSISNFELLQRYCDYFNIDTWCSEILDLLYFVKREGPSVIKQVCDKNIVIQKGLF